MWNSLFFDETDKNLKVTAPVYVVAQRAEM